MHRIRLSGLLVVPLLSVSLLLSSAPALGNDAGDQALAATSATFGFAWQAPTKGKGHGVNRPQAGTTVPVTFTLATRIYTTKVVASGWPKVRRVDCSTKAPIAGTEWQARPFGAAGLTRVGTSYTYAWEVRPEWGEGPLACRELRIKLKDGTTQSALYRFTKAAPLEDRPPVAVADAAIITEDTAPNPIVGNVLSNDSDPNGDTLSVANAGTFDLGHGSLVIHADGTYAYTLDNSDSAVNALNNGQTLKDTFTYTVSDGHGGTDSAKLDITIHGSTDNQAPVADDDVDSVKEDTAPNPIVGNVLSNDSDTDGDILTVTNAGTFDLGHGSLVINANGSYSYTLDNSDSAVNALNDGQTLKDSFTYTVSDGHGGSDTAKLSITINGATDNQAPVAVADAAIITEDTAPNPIVGNVLSNDSDPNGDTLSVANAGTFDLGHGSLVIHADGTYAYTLDNSDSAVNALNNGQTLKDTFTYTVSDGHGGTDSAKLDITIHGSTDNQAPVADDDVDSVKEDTAPNPIVGNVLSNDSDTDGDILTVTNAGTFDLGHGSLVINANGSYSYTLDNSDSAVNALNDGQTLKDSFTYTVSDGHGGTDSAKLDITIQGSTDGGGGGGGGGGCFVAC